MNETCPLCGLQHVINKDTAKTYAGLIGVLGGLISGASAAFAGANVGSRIGMIGGIAGSLLGGLVGAVTGGIYGSKIGQVIDEKILKNLVCLSCGYEFSSSKQSDVDLNDINVPKF